jgi:hypothetical protein
MLGGHRVSRIFFALMVSASPVKRREPGLIPWSGREKPHFTNNVQPAMVPASSRYLSCDAVRNYSGSLWRVAPVSNHNEGAPGPSLLGTGDSKDNER